MNPVNEETVEQIQTKIAYLESANNELSDVVFRQQQEIRTLGMRLNALAERVDATRSGDRPPDDERPPHY
jgi:SlyX protein